MSETTDAYILASLGACKGVYEVFIKPFIRDHPEAVGAIALLSLAVYSRNAANHMQPPESPK